MSPLLRVLALIGLVIVFIWAVSEPGRHTPKPLDDFQVVQEWLHCIDCRGTFIKRMRDIPVSRSDSITRFLRTALVVGPDSARTARLTRDLLQTWLQDSAYRVGRGLPPVKEHELPAQLEFFSRYRRGFEVMWRSRAATALGVIRTPLALTALDSGLTLPLRDKGDSLIRRMVERAQVDSGRTGGEPPHP